MATREDGRTASRSIASIESDLALLTARIENVAGDIKESKENFQKLQEQVHQLRIYAGTAIAFLTFLGIVSLAITIWANSLSSTLKRVTSGTDQIFESARLKADNWLRDATQRRLSAWHPLPKAIELGSLPTSSNQQAAYDLAIPDSATEILVFVMISSGNSDRSDGARIRLYTEAGAERYEKMLYWSRYSQPAIGFNSENLWFPVTASRKLYARLEGVPSAQNVGSAVWLLGYR